MSETPHAGDIVNPDAADLVVHGPGTLEGRFGDTALTGPPVEMTEVAPGRFEHRFAEPLRDITPEILAELAAAGYQITPPEPVAPPQPVTLDELADRVRELERIVYGR